MTQFLRDQASDSEEVVTPLMLDGTYLSRNFATLGPVRGQPPCDSFLFAGDNRKTPYRRSLQPITDAPIPSAISAAISTLVSDSTNLQTAPFL